VALSSLLINCTHLLHHVHPQQLFLINTARVLGHVESHMPAPASVRIFFCITMALAANNHVLPVTPIDAVNRAASTVLLQFALIFNL